MNLPAGLIFYLDFRYGTTDNTGLKGASESLYGATSDMKRTDSNFNTGLYGAGEFGYSMETTESLVNAIHASTTAPGDSGTYTTGSVTLGGILNNDTEFSASNAGAFNGDTTDTIFSIQLATSSFADLDIEGIRAFGIDDENGHIDDFFPQFTRITGGDIEFVVKCGASTDGAGLGKITVDYQKGPDNLNDVGDFEDRSGTAPTAGDGNISTLSIPEINVQLRSDTVAAKTRKLKAQWTPEFAQDLNAYHSIDAEAELTSMLSEYISMEIDLEILDMLIKNADTVEGWSATVAKDVVASSNHTPGGTANATFTSTINDAGVYYTKMSWFQTLGIKLQKVSNLIHQKTLRGGANWMVCGPKVSTILESIPGFAADSAGDDDKYNMGAQKLGSLNNRYTVYKNPYITENIILMGYKGSQFLETGAVFAPYNPLIMTPLVYDPVSFTPRKGIMTRYAKKMVRPDFYGKVYIQDLNDM